MTSSPAEPDVTLYAGLDGPIRCAQRAAGTGLATTASVAGSLGLAAHAPAGPL